MANYGGSSRRHCLRTVGAVAVAGIAGCLDEMEGETGDDNAEPTGDDNAEPTDDDNAEPTDIDFPPGTSDDGIKDMDRLIENHGESLRTTSFAGTHEYADSGVKYAYQIEVDPDSERALERDYDGSLDDGAYEATYATDVGGSTDQGEPVNQTFEDAIEDFHAELEAWTPELTAEYEGLGTSDGRTVHEYSIVEFEDLLVGPQEPDERDDDGTILVDEDGRLHRYLLTRTGGEGEQELTIDFTFGSYGETTVEEPAWAPAEQAAGYHVDPGTRISLYGNRSSWIGIEPNHIRDVENPTLVLEDGEAYELGWEEGDGLEYNIEIRDEDDDVVDWLETDLTSEPDGDQWLEFEASEEMAYYVCGPFQPSMRGEIVVR